MANHVELSRRASQDLRRIGRGLELSRIVRALTETLTAVPAPANADIKRLVGAVPWLRLWIGPYRVLYRPLTSAELAALEKRYGKLGGKEGFLVERVVHRRDLDDAVSSLPRA